ncbi:MAG: tRNA (adenosine(37)-N6)-dimethylallyltransferase MiaA [Alphaproteobacteria bacterium]|nr:tRNA (adenosine(37)-N6)-dimethylallyltransferase MiaA [Alphaproteobacteria bacterium]
MQENLVIAIGGSTASGKSTLALDLAQALNGVIINADSMQVYRDTPILSANPTTEDRAKAPHVLYEIYDADKHGNVSEWLILAKEEIEKAWQQKKMPILVGGTGMYLHSLINGMSPIPETSQATKEKVSKLLEEIGTQALHKKLAEVDPSSAKKLSPNDSTRVRRAYEVWLDTKKPISKWHEEENIKILPEAKFFTIKIVPSAEEVDEKCYERFEKMITLGALEEVKKLKAKKLNKNLPAMKAIGIPELSSFLEGEISLEEAINLGKLRTRQYAKRQRTWFANKLDANLTIDNYYKNDKFIIMNIKKLLHKSS